MKALLLASVIPHTLLRNLWKISLSRLVGCLAAICLLGSTVGCMWYFPPPLAIPGAASRVLTVHQNLQQPVTEIVLAGPLTKRRAQISSLAWYGDQLILLPQFPDNFDQQIFALSRSDIVEQLAGRNLAPLEPRPIVFDDALVQAQISGSEGYEAIAFAGDEVFITIETSQLTEMLGYVTVGTMLPVENRLVLDATRLSPIAPQSDVMNLSDEALLLIHNQVATIYEANGLFINPEPIVHLFDRVTLRSIGVASFPNIEYRITDTTALDENGRFWATNVFSPETRQLRSFLRARGTDGQVDTAAQPVERLLEFAVTPQGFVRTETPPIRLELLPATDPTAESPWSARNWEGVVRLETPEFTGFLVATDFTPGTILAFVPMPDLSVATEQLFAPTR